MNKNTIRIKLISKIFSQLRPSPELRFLINLVPLNRSVHDSQKILAQYMIQNTIYDYKWFKINLFLYARFHAVFGVSMVDFETT